MTPRLDWIAKHSHNESKVQTDVVKHSEAPDEPEHESGVKRLSHKVVNSGALCPRFLVLIPTTEKKKVFHF